MTDSFVTQCPHCQTRFRINHQQLSVARGVVRCGQCLQVFNAARQLLEQSQISAVKPLTEAPAQPPQTALAAAPVAADPVAPSPNQGDWAADLDAMDLDQALAHLERRGPDAQRQRAHGDDSLQARRDDPRADELGEQAFGTANDEHLEPHHEPPPTPILLDTPAPDLDAEDSARTEPSLGTRLDLDDDERPTGLHAEHDDPFDEAPPLREPALERSGLSALDDEVAAVRVSARDDDDHLEPADETGADERLEPMLSSTPSRTRKAPLVEVIDDPLQLGWQKPAPNWGKRLLWGALALIAAGLLVFQYVYYHFDEMARHDRYRPLFQQLCPTLGCQVPTRVDINRIKSSNLVVRSHPDFKGALIVDAIIYNRAPFSQPFPLLELRFADLNGQLIASRRFKPSEYLSGELAGRGEMPSQTPIHIALDILDPGPKAVNYSLSFRSPD